jgi:predicted negative regulator of RcsB-dependent stress response
VDDYLSEKEQIERVRQWLSENGRSIATGLLLGLAAVAFLWWWRPYRDHQLAEASSVYAQLVEAADAGERDQAVELAKQLDGYWRTPYSMQGALVLARMYMDADEPQPAAEQLEKVVNGARDDEFVQIARLRLARVRLYQQQADKALEILGTENPGKFAPLYHEARGDILYALKRNDEARAEYEQALATLDPGIADRTLLEMKLNDVAAAPPPDAAADAGS